MLIVGNTPVVPDARTVLADRTCPVTAIDAGRLWRPILRLRTHAPDRIAYHGPVRETAVGTYAIAALPVPFTIVPELIGLLSPYEGGRGNQNDDAK